MSAEQTAVNGVASKFEVSRQRTRWIAVALISLLSGAALLQSLSLAMSGEIAAFGRIALGTAGAAAAVLLWRHPPLGYRLAVGWAAVQCLYVAWTPTGGSPTTQWLELPVTFSSESSVNGVTTSFFALGVNLVGPVALALLRSRSRALTAR